MRVLVWFRSDLRTDDNTAFVHACQDATRGVIGVFTVCAAQWCEHDWADTKVEFLLRNLACLAERLKRLNIPLLILQPGRFDNVPAALADLAHRHQCDALYFNREYEVNEQRRDAAVTDLFSDAGLSVRGFDDQTVVAPGTVQTKAGSFFTVFTPFKRAWVAYIEARGAGACLPAPRPQPELLCAPDLIPEQVPGFDLSRGQPELWTAGERPAAAQLSAFIECRLSRYKKDRDEPAADGTSRLSPYLTLGVISPRRCLEAARAANRGRLDAGLAGPNTWITQLIWREFYRHVLVGFPRISMRRAFKPATEQLPWRHEDMQFRAWCDGRTGVPIVDAGMRQLFQTGWMHNRLRMIVAMYLTKDLFIDWRWGERHFMRHLIDGDLASNNGGWQWSASTGTDAVPYFRVFNPASQSRKFDPDGDFIREHVPELGDMDGRSLHNPDRWPAGTHARLDYPEPLCDHAEARRKTIAAFRGLQTNREIT